MCPAKPPTPCSEGQLKHVGNGNFTDGSSGAVNTTAADAMPVLYHHTERLPVCMYVCMYVLRMYVCMYMCLCVCVYIYKYIYIYIYMCVCVCVCVCICKKKKTKKMNESN